MRSIRIEPGALAASVAGHCLLVAAGAWLWSSHRSASEPAPLDSIVVEADEPKPTGDALLPGAESKLSVPLPHDPPPLRQSNASSVARPDSNRSGRGSVKPGERATNLSSSVDPLTLERDTPNHVEQSQVQRLLTARRRQSWDDRRATPNPMELSFVASGRGNVVARRPIDLRESSSGLLSREAPHAVGATQGALEGDAFDGVRGAATSGEPRAPSAGAPTRSRGEPKLSAPIVLARPSVPASRAAVPAAERDRPNDTRESDQRVALRVASLLQASTLGGDAAQGIGGEPGPSEAGSGQGMAAGARAQAAGTGTGLGEPSADPALDPFYRGLRARLERALEDTFPQWAALEGRGGLVVFEFALDDSGRVTRVALVRSSGIGEFDRNVVAAARQVGGFAHVPPVLSGRTIRFTYDERNPAVGRRGPGPGHVAD
ncbi:MAG: TonB family protein [Polyangiaceae bacterium]